MSVMLVSNGFQPNYEKAYANGLAHNGVPVELVGSDRTLYAELAAGIKAINLRGSQNPNRSKLTKALNLLSYVIKLYARIYIQHPHVLHLNGLLLGGVGPKAVIELMLCRFGAKRLWLTVHNLVPHGKHAHAGQFFLRLLYRIPHLLVVHTEKMKHDLICRYGVPSERIVVMQHGVDEVPERAAWSQPTPDLKVLLFGGVMPYKGVDLFLQALTHCHDVAINATLAGEARDSAYAAQIDRMIGEVRPPHNVKWVRGYIPEHEVQGFFERADVVVMPYRHIDQSGVLFTAYRFGAPVVCFDVGAFRDYVPEYAGQVVRSQTAQALAEALAGFKQKIRKYDRNAIQTYARSFSWNNTVKVLLPRLT